MEEKLTDKELEYYIKKFKKTRSERDLIGLIVVLKEVSVLVPIDTEQTINYSEIKEKQNRTFDIYPLVVYSTDKKSWFASFSKDSEISKEIKEKYTIINVPFIDLINDCFEHDDIDGITINPLSDMHIHLEKNILEVVRTF